MELNNVVQSSAPRNELRLQTPLPFVQKYDAYVGMTLNGVFGATPSASPCLTTVESGDQAGLLRWLRAE